MNDISGLPSHPLFVHAAIVLIPLLAVITVALAVKAAWRAKWGVPVTIANFLSLVYLSVLVMESGEHLAEKLKMGKRIHEHEELANMTRLLLAVMFLGLLGLVIVDRLQTKLSAAGTSPTWAKPVAAVSSVATIIVAVLSVIWMFRTGHEGADVTWAELWKQVNS
jgi:hypothetical protein